MHGCIVNAGCLVKVDIETVIGFHLQRCLHAGGTCWGLATIGGDSLLHTCSNTTQTCGLPFIFLCIIVSGNPPCLMVTCQSEFCLFLLDCKIGKILLVGEFITKSEPIVEKAETNVHLPVIFLLRKMHNHFVVMVTYSAFLTPNGMPKFVERGICGGINGEACLEVCTTRYSIFGCGWGFPIEIGHLRRIFGLQLIPKM